jgi:hypothetical protein
MNMGRSNDIGRDARARRHMGRAAISVAALCAVAAGSVLVLGVSMGGVLVLPAHQVEGSCIIEPPPVLVAAMGVAFPTGAVAGLGAGVAALWWIRLARVNAAVLSAVPRRLAPFWAVGCWFVPIVNLVLPPRVLLDIWAASGEHVPWTRVVRAWWASVWVCGLLAVTLVLVGEGAGGLDDDAAVNGVLAVLIVLLAVVGNGAAALFAATVLKITADQGGFRRSNRDHDLRSP